MIKNTIIAIYFPNDLNSITNIKIENIDILAEKAKNSEMLLEFNT
ncbi:hypothetical protein [uncultured Brachyspira sp.]|nr:hypothetical protein [uncultured Brachyspira sp.]